jgi:hypothetical protein
MRMRLIWLILVAHEIILRFEMLGTIQVGISDNRCLGWVDFVVDSANKKQMLGEVEAEARAG